MEIVAPLGARGGPVVLTLEKPVVALCALADLECVDDLRASQTETSNVQQCKTFGQPSENFISRRPCEGFTMLLHAVAQSAVS